MMPTIDPTFVRQLHADRAARLAGGRRLPRLHLPASLFARKERRRLAVRPATTC